MRYRREKRMERKRNKDPCQGCVWPMYRDKGRVICPFQRCVRKEYEPLWQGRKAGKYGQAEAD